MLRKVFLVEDETVIREGLRDRIPWDQFGYRFVGEAADGEMALTPPISVGATAAPSQLSDNRSGQEESGRWGNGFASDS